MSRFVALSAVVLALVAFSVAPASAAGGYFEVTMDGDEEVPGPGDPDGYGNAHLHIKPRLGTVCFRIEVFGIRKPATGAHIHAGAEGVAGPIVVTLVPPDEDGESEECVTGYSRSLLNQITANPEQYYVNVHNTRYPAGAVRGQLA